MPARKASATAPKIVIAKPARGFRTVAMGSLETGMRAPEPHINVPTWLSGRDNQCADGTHDRPSVAAGTVCRARHRRFHPITLYNYRARQMIIRLKPAMGVRPFDHIEAARNRPFTKVLYGHEPDVRARLGWL